MAEGLLFFTQPLIRLLGELGHHPLHASYVWRTGQRLLFLGEGRAGKSTLAVLLSLHGWNLACDDLVFMSSSADGKLELHPLPTRVKSRSPSLTSVLSAFDAEMPAPSDQRSDEPADELLLLFPRFVPGANAEVVPLGVRETTRRILTMNQMKPQPHTVAQFPLLCSLSERARSAELVYGNEGLREAVERIEHWSA